MASTLMKMNMGDCPSGLNPTELPRALTGPEEEIWLVYLETHVLDSVKTIRIFLKN